MSPVEKFRADSSVVLEARSLGRSTGWREEVSDGGGGGGSVGDDDDQAGEVRSRFGQPNRDGVVRGREARAR